MISAMSKKRALLTICPLYLLFFMGDAFLTSYYALFFQSNGVTGERLSLLLGILPMALCAGCFLLSPLAKNVKASLWLFRICAFVESGLVIAYTFATSFEALLVLTCFVGFVNGAPFSFMEGYAAPAFRQAGLPYARVRMFGTIGYMVALFLGYFVLGSLPIRDCYYFAFALFLAALVLSFFVPRIEEEKPSQTEIEPDQNAAKNANFPVWGIMVFLVGSLLFYGSFNTLAYLLPIRLKEQGVSDADYSLMRSFSMVVELVALLTAPLWSKLFKAKKTALLASAGLSAVCLSFGIYLANGYALGYANLLSGVGKAILFAFQANYLQDLVGDKRLGTILTVNNGLTNLACGSLNLMSSAIYEQWGFPMFFGLLTALAAAGFIIFFFLPSPKQATPKTN